ncbi:MAG: hypothetical protein ACJZ7A_03020 [Opitutales bacterium]
MPSAPGAFKGLHVREMKIGIRTGLCLADSNPPLQGQALANSTISIDPKGTS